MSSQPPPPPSGPFGPPPSGPDQPGRPHQPGPTPSPPQQPAPQQPGPWQPAPPAGGFGPPPGGSGGSGGSGGFGPGQGGPGGFGPGQGGPGGFGNVPPGGIPPTGGGDAPKQRGALWAAIGVLVAIAVGVGVFIAVSGDDETAAPDDTEEPVDTDATDTTDAAVVTTTTVEATTTTPAPTTTVTPTLPPTLPPATTVPPTTPAPVDPNTVDLGRGVTFALPEGYTDTPSDTGSSHQLENGIVSAFFQVLEREAGESPLVLLQEYVDTFDADFDSVVYSQVIPTRPVTGVAPADGNIVFYRALNMDGTGVKGVIDATRRADGLAYVSDIFLAIDGDTDNKFPQDTIDEMFSSFLDAPLIGDEVPLSPLSIARVATMHPPVVVDGFVAVTPPAGWTVNVPGPGRVIMSRPDGQRFLGEKLGSLTDMGAAQLTAQATVLSLVPDATFGEFNTDETDRWNFLSARWGGTDPNTGQPLQGYISLWFDITTGEAYDSLEAWIGPSSEPPSLVESNFLFQAFDTSITKARV